MRAATSALVATVIAAACAADPEPHICPDVNVGDLVITEIRGHLVLGLDASTSGDASTTGDPSTTGASTTGASTDSGGNATPGRDWVEIANLTGTTLDARGLVLRTVDLDGSNEVKMPVRTHRNVAAGDYFVFGLVDDNLRPPHVDYGVEDDWPIPDTGGSPDANLYLAGSLELSACDTTLDTVAYDGLPSDGSWSLGASPPDPATNDLPASWCDDTVVTIVGTDEEPGTPGAPNRPCD